MVAVSSSGMGGASSLYEEKAPPNDEDGDAVAGDERDWSRHACKLTKCRPAAHSLDVETH